MTTPTIDREPTRIELRQQAHYWQTMHARAVEREQQWKAQAQQWESRFRQQEKTYQAALQ